MRLFYILLLCFFSFGFTSNNVTLNNVDIDTRPSIYSSTLLVSVAGDALESSASRGRNQRKGFYTLNRHWVFYVDRDNDPNEVYFTSSTDNGLTWETGVKIDEIEDGDIQYQIQFDGSNVHYLANRTYTPNDVHGGQRYRNGTPQSNGTITWNNSLQTIQGNTVSCGDMSFDVDDDGSEAWIGYGHTEPNNIGTVTVNTTTTTGTWATDANFPHAFSNPNAGADKHFAEVVSLGSGKAYVAQYFWDGDAIDYEAVGHYFDGSSWSSEGDVTDINVESNYNGGARVARIAADQRGGEVYLTYLSNTGLIRFNIRSAGDAGTWGTEETIEDTDVDDQSNPNMFFEKDDGSVWFTWERVTGGTSTDGIWVVKREADGTLRHKTQILSGVDLEGTFAHLSVYEEVGNNQVGIMTLTADYDVMFYIVDIPD